MMSADLRNRSLVMSVDLKTGKDYVMNIDLLMLTFSVNKQVKVISCDNALLELCRISITTKNHHFDLVFMD